MTDKFRFFALPHVVTDDAMTWQDNPSTIVAVGAYIPEDTYSSLDMSMPKYDTSASDDLLAAPGYKLPNAPDGGSTSRSGGGGGYNIKPLASKKGEDPQKALARAKKEAEKEAANRAAKEKKQQEILAKMQAKKAERAAIQGRREAALE